MAKWIAALVIIPLSILINNVDCFGQKQGNLWWIPYGLGLNFNDNPASVFHETEYIQSTLPFPTNIEGTATLSDSKGKLLFFTDGERVWNRQQEVMKNGSGLLGHPSSTNAGVILPMPGHNQKYYVFTTWAFIENLKNGLHYSIVDMCGDKGLGEVVEKNTPLLALAGERLAITQHANGVDYWLLSHVHFSSDFHAFHITENGISEEVVTSIGSYHGTVDFDDDIGQMKISPDGKHVAITAANRTPQMIDLFDFDASSGRLSNYVNLGPKDQSYGGYGLAFSPNSSKLYCQVGFEGLYEFDIATTSTGDSAIWKSRVVLPNVATNYYPLGMQLGPDGKIYVDFARYIGVIDNPDEMNPVYDQRAYDLGPTSVISYAFPSFLDNFRYPNKDGVPLDATVPSLITMCNGAPVILQVTAGDSVKYLWNDGSTNAQYTATSPGLYTVEMSKGGCTIKDSITVRAIAFRPLPADTTVCEGKNAIIDAHYPGITYHWNDGSAFPVDTIKASGSYWVDRTQGTCTLRDTINVAVLPTPFFSFGNDTTLCGAQRWQLALPGIADKYQWQDGSAGQKFNVVKSGLFIGTAFENTCQWIDSIRVNYIKLPDINLGMDTVTCDDHGLTLDGPTGDFTFLWSTGATSSSIQISGSGLYSLQISSGHCYSSGAIDVNFIPCKIIMPNIFSPNGDGVNEAFVPIEISGIADAKEIIVDRWGLEISRNTDLVTGWDGSARNGPLDTGVYFWVITYSDIDRRTNTMKGNVTLTR